jgi:predicted nucleic acid-binding protein
VEALVKARRVYVDANPIIYFLEDQNDMRRLARSAYHVLIANEAQLITSEFTLAECLHGAFKRQNALLIERYQHLFETTDVFDVVPVHRGVLKFAAKLAPEKGLKLADAIHFATAYISDCDVFLTNDVRFRSSHGVAVALLAGLKAV